jgi:uncharacterized membrane protein
MTPRFFHYLAAFSAAGFLLAFLLWPTVWVPNRFDTAVAVLLSLPGFIALPGLIRGKVYTHAWSTLLSTLYIAYASLEAYANPAARSPALLCMCLGASWFIASNLFVRGQRIQRLP